MSSGENGYISTKALFNIEYSRLVVECLKLNIMLSKIYHCTLLSVFIQCSKFKEHHNRLQLTTMPTNLPERNG